VARQADEVEYPWYKLKSSQWVYRQTGDVGFIFNDFQIQMKRTVTGARYIKEAKSMARKRYLNI